MYGLCNIEARLSNHCCMEKQCVTFYDCVFLALLIQHAKGMGRVILPAVTYPALPCFSTLCHQRHDFQKEVIGHKLCFDFL